MNAKIIFTRLPSDVVRSSVNNGSETEPIDIPVQTVLDHNEHGFFGRCESVESPASTSFDTGLFDSIEASKFVKNYIDFNDKPLHSGTRSSKRRKEKEASHQKSLNLQNRLKQKAIPKLRKPVHDFDEESDEDFALLSKKEINVRKRSDDRNRAFNRQVKEIFLGAEITEGYETSSISYTLNISLVDKLIDVRDEFKSLNSKCVVGSPVHKSNNIFSCDYDLSLPFPSSDIIKPALDHESQNRSDFYHNFAVLLKSGSKDKCDGIAVQKQPEELSFQTKLMDVIWLELQAWHNNRSLKEQDDHLCEARKNISDTIKNVLSYEYKSTFGTSCCSPPPILSIFDSQNVFSNCSLSCNRFIYHVNQAYTDVSKLLDSIYEIEGTYPTQKALSRAESDYSDRNFQLKYQTLCIWFNMMNDLRIKLHLFTKLTGVKSKWNITINEDDKCPKCISSRSRNDSGLFSSPSASPSPPTMPDNRESPFLFDVEMHDKNKDEDSALRLYVKKNLLIEGGLKKMLMQLKTFLCPTIIAIGTMVNASVPSETYASVASKSQHDEEHQNSDAYFGSYKKSFCKGQDLVDAFEEEFNDSQIFSNCFKNMALPSMIPFYLYLVKMPLNIVHEYLLIRLEQQPKNPSLVIIQELITQTQEVIAAGTLVRQMFIDLMDFVEKQSIMKPDIPKANSKTLFSQIIEAELLNFNQNIRRIFELYLSYIRLKSEKIQLLSDPSEFKLIFEDDWSFMKLYSAQIHDGKVLAATQFCEITRGLLENISKTFGLSITNAKRKLNDILEDHTNTSSFRENIYDAIRNYKNILVNVKAKALKAISLAKNLRKDLEIFAECQLNTEKCKTWKDFVCFLHSTNHVMVQTQHCKQYLIFFPEFVLKNKMLFWRLLNSVSDSTNEKYECNSEMPNEEGYMLLLYSEDPSETTSSWNGRNVVVNPKLENNITLSTLQCEGLLFIASNSCQLSKQCTKFRNEMNDAVQLKCSSKNGNISIDNALNDLKEQALNMRHTIEDTINEVQIQFELTGEIDYDATEVVDLKSLCKDILIQQAYRFGFEFHRDLIWLSTGRMNELVSGLFSFAKMWMNFSMSWIPRGPGFKPTYVVQGLDFLSLICNPRFTNHLPENEFKSLKTQISSTVQHLIGSDDISHKIASNNLSSPIQTASSYFGGSESSFKDTPLLYFRNTSITSTTSEPDFAADKPRVGRIRKAISMVDEKRDQVLFEQNRIGQICNISSRNNKFVARQVTFRWQRGKKIGEGRFGRVYSVVNNDTGNLIAMKEIRIPLGDHKAVKDITDEIYILEHLHHKHLVRYYGVEVHREEMYIFMELCNEGTLEYASKLGLLESTICKYSYQLLVAISFLHDHKIVHRDIKPANIFLTSNGNLKLGDFGCCIKLKNQATMPGELATFVGTPAYMAPEIITQSGNKGHGRAADIWSFGCVVIEMFSGKRPWLDLENNQQIMFKVGMGGTPEIPFNTSDEGKDFIKQCLVHDPSQRPVTQVLLNHPFIKLIIP